MKYAEQPIIEEPSNKEPIDENAESPVAVGDIDLTFRSLYWMRIRHGVVWVCVGLVATMVTWLLSETGEFFIFWGLSIYGLICIGQNIRELRARSWEKAKVTPKDLAATKAKVKKKISKILMWVAIIGTLVVGYFFTDSLLFHRSFKQLEGIGILEEIPGETELQRYVAQDYGFALNTPVAPGVLSNTFYHDKTGHPTTLFVFIEESGETTDDLVVIVIDRYDADGRLISDIKYDYVADVYEYSWDIDEVDFPHQIFGKFAYSYDFSDKTHTYASYIFPGDRHIYQLTYSDKKGRFSHDKLQDYLDGFELLNPTKGNLKSTVR